MDVGGVLSLNLFRGHRSRYIDRHLLRQPANLQKLTDLLWCWDNDKLHSSNVRPVVKPELYPHICLANTQQRECVKAINVQITTDAFFYFIFQIEIGPVIGSPCRHTVCSNIINIQRTNLYLFLHWQYRQRLNADTLFMFVSWSQSKI